MEKWVRANYQPNLPLGEDGRKITACAEHLALARKAGTEGMVLLKNAGKSFRWQRAPGWPFSAKAFLTM